MRSVNILITSVGRRKYLVDWFREAGAVLEVRTCIVTADGDPSAAALAYGDIPIVLPRFNDSEYIPTLAQICGDHSVDLLLSVNDYDIALLSRKGIQAIQHAGSIPVIPPPTTISIAEDKLKMGATLRAAGISTPASVLASSFDSGNPSSLKDARRLVVKHRFGSGSSGLLIVSPDMLEHALALSIESAPDNKGVRAGSSRDDLVIVQEAIEGEEYGLDVVCSFDGEFQGVLARRKVRMRAGETDRAVTVDATPFEALGRKLASSFELRGLTDVDVIVNANGDQLVIDINPRFGGGYPFCHLAGANVPACYVAWALGREIDPAWLRPEPGVMSSKYEAIRRV